MPSDCPLSPTGSVELCMPCSPVLSQRCRPQRSSPTSNVVGGRFGNSEGWMPEGDVLMER